jgi:hypothetical protein
VKRHCAARKSRPVDGAGGQRNSRTPLIRHGCHPEDAVRRHGRQGINLPEGEPVLIVARPETYIENIKTPLRIVLADGVENFATSLMQLRPILSPAVVEDIVHALGGVHAAPPVAEEPVQAAVPVMPRSGTPTVPAAALVTTVEPEALAQPEVPVVKPARRGRMSRKQILLLVLLGLANLCVLSALAIVVATNVFAGS